MRAFERPNGQRLFPEPSYISQRLEEADDTAEALADLFQEAREGLNRLEDLNREIRDLAQEERDLELDLHALRKQRRKDPFRRPYDNDELDQLIDERSTKHDRLVERRRSIQDERDALAKHLARNFVALKITPGAVDFSPPDVQAIKREVGEPVSDF